MTEAELKQAAIEVLGKAFAGTEVPAYIVQAAITMVLSL